MTDLNSSSRGSNDAYAQYKDDECQGYSILQMKGRAGVVGFEGQFIGSVAGIGLGASGAAEEY